MTLRRSGKHIKPAAAAHTGNKMDKTVLDTSAVLSYNTTMMTAYRIHHNEMENEMTILTQIKYSTEIAELKVKLIDAIQRTHHFGNEAKREFSECLWALESGTNEDISEALRSGPLGCGTESSYFDNLNSTVVVG